MKNIFCIAAVMIIATLLVSCAAQEADIADPQVTSQDNVGIESTQPDLQAGLQDNISTESTPPGPQADSQDIASAESSIPDFLNEIGKPYPELTAEHPSATITLVDIPDAVAICLTDPVNNYSYRLFGTQYISFDILRDDTKEQMKCSGIVTTAGGLFPQTDDNMAIDEFFSAIGVSDYNYNIEDATDQGWFDFEYQNLRVYIDTTSDSHDVDGNFIPVQAIKSDYTVIIWDSALAAENFALLDDY